MGAWPEHHLAGYRYTWDDRSIHPDAASQPGGFISARSPLAGA